MTVFFTGIYAPLTPDERVVLDEKLARNQKEFLGLTAQLNGDALISKLPDSVLLMVFAQHIAAWKEDIIDTHFIRDTILDVTSGRPYYGWIRLAHVCRRWRDVALRTPSLWTHFKVTSVEGADAFLERSGGAPIYVEGCMTAQSFDFAATREIWTRVFEEAHRTASLHVSFDEDFDKYPEHVGLGYPAFPRLKSLKLLRNGSNLDSTNILPRFIQSDQRFQGLEEFQATNYTLPLIAPLFIGCQNLTSLSLSGFGNKEVTWEMLFDMLGRFPLLQRLTLRQGFPAMRLESPNGLPTLPSDPVSLPYLQELDLSSLTAGLDCAHLLQHLTAPHDATVRTAVGNIYAHQRFNQQEPPKTHDDSLPFVVAPLISWLTESEASGDPLGSLYIDSFCPVPWLDRKYAIGVAGYASGTRIQFVRKPDASRKSLRKLVADQPPPIETTWSTYSPELIFNQFVALSAFSRVKILILGDIRSQPDLPTPASVDTWFEVFGQLTKVTDIRITGRTSRLFPYALATRNRTPDVLFPNLRVLSLVRAVFVDLGQDTEDGKHEWFETLRKELLARNEDGRGLTKINIEDARNITATLVEALQDASAGRIEWDEKNYDKVDPAEADEPWADELDVYDEDA